MNSHMLIQITFLGKWLGAPIDGTYIRLLLSVRSQVIKKIVPLFESSVALFMLANEHLSPPFAFRFEVFYILKSAHTRNVKTLF